MDLVQATILGIVEGLTEFTPVSSTFHLIWTSRFLGIAENDFVKLFEIVIQSGAILAILALYLDTLRRDRELDLRLIASFIPTGIVGFLLFRLIRDVFLSNATLQLVMFIGIGALFILLELWLRGRTLKRDAGSLSYVEAVFVGLCQSIAVIPGVSRAGAVIVGMLLVGVRREEAARYSFLLAVPTIIAAGAYDLYQSRSVLASSTGGVTALIVGGVVSFVVALVVVRWLVGYLQRHTLIPFGAYRVIAGALLALFGPR